MIALLLAPMMLALALLFVWHGFRRFVPMTLDQERAIAQKQLLQKHLGRLEHQRQQGLLTDEQFASQQAEWARPVLQELSLKRSRLQPARRAPIAWLLALLLAVPLSAGALYWRLGAHQGLLLQAQMQEGLQSPADERRMLATWESWLERKPKDVDGWYIIGRSYLSLGEFDQAEAAFLRALAALGRFESPRVEDQAAIYAHLAQVRFLPRGQLDAVAADYLQTALRLASDDRTANSLAAIVAFQDQAYLTTLRHLEQVLALPMPDVERAAFIRLQEQAQQAFLAEGGDPLQLASLAGQGFVLQLTRPSWLAQEDLPVLFITAHQSGNRLPLAVRRLTPQQWPVTTSLTEQHLMTQGQRFVAGEPIILQARLSRTGSATPTADDWVSSAVVLQTPETLAEVELVIDQPWQGAN